MKKTQSINPDAQPGSCLERGSDATAVSSRGDGAAAQSARPVAVLGVTGSIAAYKAAELVRLLIKGGFDVHVVMTAAAVRFVGELTFRTLSCNPVLRDAFEEPEAWQPGHVSLADRADVFVVAPCTANVMAKIALGLSDDLLSATALATRAPMLLAPAMNVHMWDHPATRKHVDVLRRRGVRVLDVAEGDLACGYRARGRMAEPVDILEAIRNLPLRAGALPSRKGTGKNRG